MKHSCFLLAALVLALLVAAPATAQSSAGDQELGFFASYINDPNQPGDGSVSASVRYGLFLDPKLQLGGGLLIGGPVDELEKFARVELFGAYYFSPEEVNTFYARGGLLTLIDDPGEAFLDLAGGYKSYFSERAAFFWEAGYGHPIGDADDGVFRSVAGLTFQF